MTDTCRAFNNDCDGNSWGRFTPTLPVTVEVKRPFGDNSTVLLCPYRMLRRACV